MLEDAVAILEALGVAGAGDDPFLPYLIKSVTERVNPGQVDPVILGIGDQFLVGHTGQGVRISGGGFPLPP